MARINNSDTIKRILDDAGIQTSHDEVPHQLASKVVPVLIANPKRIVNYSDGNVKSVTGNLTISPNTTNKQFYLTNLHVGFSKDVTCDVAIGRLQVSTTINGEVVSVIDFPILSVTAERDFKTVHFDPPLKIDIGKAVTMTGTYTAGLMARVISINGYYVEE